MYLKKFQSVKYVVRLMSEKPRFRTPFSSQHIKGSQTLVKSELHHLYHIFHRSKEGDLENVSLSYM